MLKTVSRALIMPLLALVLAGAGLALVAAAPEQALADNAGSSMQASSTQIGTQASQAALKKAYVGKYDIVKMTKDGVAYGKSKLAVLKAQGYPLTFTMKKNGKAILNVLGDKKTGTWKATSKTRGTVVIDGQNIAMKKKGKKITLSQSSASLTFKKM